MMSKIWIASVAALLLTGGLTFAAPLDAELVMGEKTSWQGKILSREGDSISFSKSGQPVRINVASIKAINFKVNLNAGRLKAAMNNFEYEAAITALSQALEPFAEYGDVPSNLTPYNALLMELYYRTGQFEKAIDISAQLVADDRNADYQAKAQTYNLLALIDSGNIDGATAQMTAFGWETKALVGEPADKLYVRAKLQALNGDYSAAMELAANVVAFHSQDPDWIQPAEILCAEIYMELGKYASAEEVCRQVILLYENTPEYDQAKKLRTRIEQLRAEEDLQNLNSNEI